MWRINVLASGSTGNCAVVSDGTTSVLIDTGIPAAKISMLKDVAAILLTHEHGDHAKFANAISERYEKPLYGLFDTLSNIHAPERLLIPVEPNKAVRIGNLKVVPFLLNHDVPCCGYYMLNEYNESLAWISDTSEIDAEITADIYCIECNYDEETLDERGQNGDIPVNVYGRLISDWGHMSIQRAAEYIKTYAPENAVVIAHHLSQHHNVDIERVESVFGRPVLIQPEEYIYGHICPY